MMFISEDKKSREPSTNPALEWKINIYVSSWVLDKAQISREQLSETKGFTDTIPFINVSNQSR